MAESSKRWPKFVKVYTAAEMVQALGADPGFDIIAAKVRGQALTRLAASVHPKFVDKLQRVIAERCVICRRRNTFTGVGEHCAESLAHDWNEAVRRCGYTELFDDVSGEPAA